MNHRTNPRVNLTGGYFDIVPQSPHNFAPNAHDISKEAQSEGSYMAGPSVWNTFNCYTIAYNANWTTMDPVNAQFVSVQDPAESFYQANVPWDPEHPQYEKVRVDAGNGAFVPKPGYPFSMFKSREYLFRASDPVRPYYSPEGLFLVRENDHDQGQHSSRQDIVAQAYDSESSQEPQEPHEHVFSVITGPGTPDNPRGRKRKLTQEEKERTLEVRKDGACWACHLSKTKVRPILKCPARSKLMAFEQCSPCSSGSPCEQCTRLVGKRRFCLLPCFNDSIDSLHTFLIPGRPPEPKIIWHRAEISRLSCWPFYQEERRDVHR